MQFKRIKRKHTLYMNVLVTNGTEKKRKKLMNNKRIYNLCNTISIAFICNYIYNKLRIFRII